ncbi:GIY-YIG nuclease family protein, partial [Lysinibacillus sp. BF-4]|uniref:GIY-YIG nuclease family protein n=1 Tax=Lysinibacillus sp. BF-4 TaxID=1473546 RepID=UPI00055A06C5
TTTHNQGKGAKYTKARLPVQLKYYELYQTKREAMQREYSFKQLTRTQKIKQMRGE